MWIDLGTNEDKLGPERKFEWLEMMRGLAAVWVLLHHADQSTKHFVSDTGINPWLANGFLGVDFFFVLSGFIIAFAAVRIEDRKGTFGDYISARLIRIYIPYLPVGITIFILYLVLPNLSEGARTPGALSSLTLIPTNNPPALSVAWTLIHELIFYCFYALYFASRTLLVVSIFIWVTSILTVTAFEMDLSRVAWYFLSPINLCFVLGIFIYWLNIRFRLDTRAVFALFALGFFLVASQVINISPNRVLVAIGFSAWVWAAASPASINWAPWRSLVILGSSSYAIYLVHNPVLALFVRMVPVGVEERFAFALISTVALASGLVYWRVYERPALKWARERFLHVKQPRVL